MDVVDKLKRKVIDEYNYYVKRLNKGYRDDYYDLMQKINLLEVYKDIDNPSLFIEFYLRNEVCS